MIFYLNRILPGFVICLLFTCRVTASEGVILELSAGDQAVENTVVESAVPASLKKHDHFVLMRMDNNKPVSVQVDRHGREPKLVWIMRDQLKAGAVRKYRLTGTEKEGENASKVTVTDDGKRLLINVGKKPVLAYNHAVVPAPDPKEQYYARSGYIHPLYNPSGQVVSDDFNPDHAHQHGVMFAWRKMTFEGRETNGWDQKSELGKVQHASIEDFGSGPVFGFIETKLQHVDLTAEGGAKPVLDETWSVRVYNFEDAFQFDITSIQSCAADEPVSIDKIHYGGMTLRGSAEWQEHHNFDFLTSEGKTKADGNQTRPRWVDMSGLIDDQLTGTLIMGHKTNFRFPQPVRLHPTMPYFCFAPASLDSFTIQPGKPYTSRYRFYVHDGKPDASQADQMWRQYSHSPQVKVVAEN